MSIYVQYAFTCRQNDIGILNASKTYVLRLFHLFPSKLRNFEKHNLLCLKTRVLEFKFAKANDFFFFFGMGKVMGSNFLLINTYFYVSYHILITFFRQCLCIYKSQKIVERFALAVQSVVSLCVRVLKTIKNCLPIANASSSSAPSEVNDMKKDIWSHEELERLLQYVAKVFMLQFPLYAGPKQAGLRNEEISATEAPQIPVYCDVHDSTDFPVSLLRNVSFFCKSGGLLSMAKAFLLLPEDLPPSLAHALISILCNVKLWLNYRAVTQLFTPVRSNALR